MAQSITAVETVVVTTINFLRMKHLIVFLTLLTGSLNLLAEGNNSVIAEGAKLELLSRGFSFTEGPCADSKGNVYFTDQNLDRILKWSTDDLLTVFMSPAGRANGMVMDREDHIIACADAKNEIWKIALDGTYSVVMRGDAYNGKLFNGPNDVWAHPDGSYYFTDPMYRRPWWGNREQKEIDGEYVYRMSSDKKIQRIIADVKKPNGIIGTPDGKKLYVADIGAGLIYKYKLTDEGQPESREIFCKSSCDGMTLDEKGNLYVTNNRGVVVFDKNGKELEVIPVPEGWTANVCFGGKDHNKLFITASKGFYSIKLKYRGADFAGTCE